MWCLWFSGRSGTAGLTIDLVNLEVSSNLNNSMILPFMKDGLKHIERRFELNSVLVLKQRSDCRETF